MSISVRTRKFLWGLAHDRCAATGCAQRLLEQSISKESGEQLYTVFGEEAHIRSSRVDGPRHDSDYPSEQLDDYDNLILLCPTHHTQIDANDGAAFGVDYLLKLKKDHERREDRRKRLDGALVTYLNERFNSDDRSLFEQVDLRPRVDAIFVDVPMGALPSSAHAPLMRAIAVEAPGDVDEVAAQTYVMTGAAQAFLHPSWQGNALVVGGPGQGKSTLLQYICQFHRARRLNKAGQYTGDAQELQQVTTTYRFPIRVELRSYVAWAKTHATPSTSSIRKKDRKKYRKKQREPGAPILSQGWPSLESFLAHDIKTRSDHAFSVADLGTLVSTEPVLLALDGLDEVAALEDRHEVSRQVAATQGRLSADAVNLMILVTTRPGAESSPLWSAAPFPRLHLLPLTPGLRLQYLQRWATVADLDQEATDRLQRTFLSSDHEQHIAELTASPMQLAILLHLLYRKGLLPQQRSELYREYIDTFLDREQIDDKEPLLSEDRQLIEEVHEYLAWYLQTSVEEGASGGFIRRADLLGRNSQDLWIGVSRDLLITSDLLA